MKTFLSSTALSLLAAPAFAHADGHFHTHGAEVFLVMVLVLAFVAYALFRQD